MDPKQLSQAYPLLFWAVLFPLFFLAIWSGGVALASYLGGWNALSKVYSAIGPFDGAKWKCQSGQMRYGANYNNCLTVGADPVGLYLDVLFLFKFKHPALLIPWSEISVRRRKVWIFGEWAVLTLGRETGVTLTIRSSLAEKLKAASMGRWPVDQV